MFLKDTSYGGKVLNKLNKVINDSGVTSISILDKICEKMIEFEIKTGITPNTIFLGKKEESEMKVHFRKPIVKNLQYEGAMVLIVDTDSCVKVS